MFNTSHLYARALADNRRPTVEAAVQALLSNYRDELVYGRVLLVPDLHYPYHSSTGLVTNPTVVEALVDAIGEFRNTEVAIGFRAGPQVSSAAAARVLGYHRLADRHGVDCIDLGSTGTTRRRLKQPDGPVALDIPDPLEEASVVTVPTLRSTSTGELAGGMTTMATAVQPDDPTPEEVWAAVGLCEPTASLLDATITYTGEARTPGYLLAGGDVVAVDAIAADAVGHRPTAVDGETVRDAVDACTVEGTPPREALGNLPSGAIEAETNSEAMAAGYRLYARLSGDAVPPQFVR